MSIYGYTTKRDLTKLGSFLMMGLIGIIIALVYSQPDLRLTVADWLRSASDFLIESVQVNLEYICNLII